MRLGPVHDSWLKHVDSYSTGMVVLTVSLYPLSILSSPSSLLILHAPREKKKKKKRISPFEVHPISSIEPKYNQFGPSNSTDVNSSSDRGQSNLDEP